METDNERNIKAVLWYLVAPLTQLYVIVFETLLQVQVQPLLNCVTFGSFLIWKMDVINSISMNKLVVKIK